MAGLPRSLHNADQYQSMPIKIMELIPTLINSSQCRSMPDQAALISINHRESMPLDLALRDIERNWSALIDIERNFGECRELNEDMLSSFGDICIKPGPASFQFYGSFLHFYVSFFSLHQHKTHLLLRYIFGQYWLVNVNTCLQIWDINPHTVVRKLHPNPVLRGLHGPRVLFQVKRHFTSWQRASLCLNIGCSSKKCDLVVLGLCEDYAKGLLSITFHSSKVTISVTPGSVRTPHNWMRVNILKNCTLFFQWHLVRFRQ